MNPKRLGPLIIAVVIVIFLPLTVLAEEQSIERQQLEQWITKLFDERAHMLVHSTDDNLQEYYLTSEAAARGAFRQEKLRKEYIQTWAGKRFLSLTDAESHIRLVRVKISGNQARVSLVQSLKLSYAYNGKPEQPQHFGIGTRHVLNLQRNDGVWKVAREYYLDPLTENPKLIPELAPAEEGMPFIRSDGVSLSIPKSGARRYQRERAVSYANKYAGLAWGAGNNNRYNQKYRDYTDLGGDCTNFASQVLGDPEEGGGLKMTHGWRYRFKAGGSESWVRTDSFKHFLLYSGYGTVVARGTFDAVVKKTDKHPNGAFAKIQPGDLIAYEMDGDVDHFSVVVGFDVHGYPLVNSHTADRYQVPFDLGWDKYTKYWLIHIKD